MAVLRLRKVDEHRPAIHVDPDEHPRIAKERVGRGQQVAQCLKPHRTAVGTLDVDHDPVAGPFDDRQIFQVHAQRDLLDELGEPRYPGPARGRHEKTDEGRPQPGELVDRGLQAVILEHPQQALLHLPVFRRDLLPIRAWQRLRLTADDAGNAADSRLEPRLSLLQLRGGDRLLADAIRKRDHLEFAAGHAVARKQKTVEPRLRQVCIRGDRTRFEEHDAPSMRFRNSQERIRRSVEHDGVGPARLAQFDAKLPRTIDEVAGGIERPLFSPHLEQHARQPFAEVFNRPPKRRDFPRKLVPDGEVPLQPGADDRLVDGIDDRRFPGHRVGFHVLQDAEQVNRRSGREAERDDLVK